MWQKERVHLTLSSEPLFYVILILFFYIFYPFRFSLLFFSVLSVILFFYLFYLFSSLPYPFLLSPLLLFALFAQQCRVGVDGMFYLADTNKLVGRV